MSLFYRLFLFFYTKKDLIKDQVALRTIRSQFFFPSYFWLDWNCKKWFINEIYDFDIIKLAKRCVLRHQCDNKTIYWFIEVKNVKSLKYARIVWPNSEEKIVMKWTNVDQITDERESVTKSKCIAHGIRFDNGICLSEMYVRAHLRMSVCNKYKT